MIISDEFEFVYIDVPKTGSISFERLFKEHFSGKVVPPTHDKNLSKHCREIPRHANNYKKIVSVRNPYDRAMSLYIYHLHAAKISQEEYSFVNFLDEIIENQSKYEKENYLMYLSMYQYLSPFDMSASTYIVQLENAREQINRLPFVSRPVEIPWRNKGLESTKSESISDDAIARINIWAVNDFELGGYQ